jgi:hypothetical protein
MPKRVREWLEPRLSVFMESRSCDPTVAIRTTPMVALLYLNVSGVRA